MQAREKVIATEHIDRKRALTKEDFMLFGRQMLVPEIGAEGQQKLCQAKVMVVGAGGLGCPVLQYLSGAGVGRLGCVDFDKIEVHNLHRQVLFNWADVGKAKIAVAEAALKNRRPLGELDFKQVKLNTENGAPLLKGYDLVIDGTDNFTTRYILSDLCKELGIPIVYGSILGFEGQMAVFGHRGSKTLRDLFPTPPPAGKAPSCAENGVLATLPGIMGLLMAQEALKLLMGLPVLNNQLLLFNTLDFQWNILDF